MARKQLTDAQIRAARRRVLEQTARAMKPNHPYEAITGPQFTGLCSECEIDSPFIDDPQAHPWRVEEIL